MLGIIVLIVMDTTQGTASNRLKLYVNGVEETVFDTEIYQVSVRILAILKFKWNSYYRWLSKFW